MLKLLRLFMHRVHNKLMHRTGNEVKQDLIIPTLITAPAYTLLVAGKFLGICYRRAVLVRSYEAELRRRTFLCKPNAN